MSAKKISFPQNLAQPADAGGQIPCAVIVGRPNVGKSSLLNCLAKQRIAIVEPTAGVTRDRISALLDHEGHIFELWDTGGIGTTDDLAEEIAYQIEVALARADVVLFVVDAQQGIVSLDQTIALQLRRIGRRVILVANKADHVSHEQSAAEFHQLGFGDPALISALNGTGRTDLLDTLADALPQRHPTVVDPVMKLAIVGRQNVGKSTFVNTLAHEERVIVSEIPGTTRDAVDVQFQRDGRTFVAVDTAGLKRKSKSGGAIDFYSLTRAYRAIRRSDVVLLMIDLSANISKVDKQLAAAIDRESKPCIITVNKWDLSGDRVTTEEYVKYLNDALPALRFAPVSFTSASNATNVDETIALAESLFTQARRQVSTSELNQALQAAAELQSPPAKHNKRPKFFYATQIATAPPTFLIFASHPQVVTEQYTRYLQNSLRETLSFPDIPIRLIFRARTRRDLDQSRKAE